MSHPRREFCIGFKIPTSKLFAEHGSIFYPAFCVHISQMEFDSRLRDRHTCGNLPIRVSQACQRSGFFLALGKRLPLLPHSFFCGILCKTSGQYVEENFRYRAALVLGKCDHRNEQRFWDFKVSRAGRGTPIYPWGSLQDRHRGRLY